MVVKLVLQEVVNARWVINRLGFTMLANHGRVGGLSVDDD